jgi:protein ImuA
MLARSSQRETVEALRQCLQEKAAARPEFSSGFDGDLPRTIRRGTLVEYLAESGSGATALALMTAREACREGGALVVIDRSRTFYPPAAAAFGLNQDTILIRPHSRKDELWALNQTLRCPGVGAMLCWPDQLEERAFRGLQIAAENGGSVGLFIRPTKVRGQPAWSDMQLLVEALPSEKLRRLRIEVVRSRCGHEGASAAVELDDETGTLQISRLVPLAAELAAPTGAVRPARA